MYYTPVVITKEDKKLERELTKQFLSKKEFTRFEKHTLKVVKAFTFSAWNAFSEAFYRDLKNNENDINEIIRELDNQNGTAVKKFIQTIEYLKTHHYIDLIQELFNNEEELIKHIDAINSYSHLKLPTNSYEVSVFSFHHGLIYLPEEKKKYLIDKDFLDCGAFIGDSALIFEYYYNPRKIYSFEPDNENYNYIFNTIELNNLKKVIPVNFGIGSKESIANFSSKNAASHISSDEGDYKINIITIDKFVFEKNLNVGLIKMDIEGYGYEALKGAVRTIKTFKPILLICIYHNVEEFVKGIKFVQNLGLDYKIMIRHLGGLIPASETHLIAW